MLETLLNAFDPPAFFMGAPLWTVFAFLIAFISNTAVFAIPPALVAVVYRLATQILQTSTTGKENTK